MFRFDRAGAAGAVLVCALMATGAQADTAKNYNLFVFNNYTANGTDTEGRVAVGGNATISSYSVGAQLNGSFTGTPSLVVGGDLKFNSGSVSYGDIVAGSISQFNNIGLPNGSKSTGTGPVDFAAEKTRLLSLSATLGAEAATGTTTNYYGGLFFEGSNPGLNVFDVSGAALGSATGFNIAIPTGSFALFNISGYGNGGTYNQMQYFGFGTQADPTKPYPSFSIAGLDSSHILYNFKDATSLSFNGIGVPGTVLAPKAAITLGYLQINGTVIADSVTGPGQINYHPYAGSLLDAVTGGTGAVPEPASWAMLIAGFGLVGAAMRRRNPAYRETIA